MKPTSSVEDKNIEFISTRSGHKVPVRVYGGEGRGIPLVMLHGLQSHSGWFTQSAAFIAGLGMPVYAMDRCGSGLSDLPKGTQRSTRDLIGDIDAVMEHVIDRHHKERLFLLGHCYGALGALAYACEYKYKLKGLILPTPAVFTKSEPAFIEKAKLVWSKLTGIDIRVPIPFKEEMLSELDEYISFAKKDELALRHLPISFFFEIAKMKLFVKRRAKEITIPIFTALAGQDPICDNERNKRFFESIRSEDKTIKTYSEARHILEFSGQREEFFRDLAEWLESHKRL
jgi:alpha-beta hydrolase superfamily lysophospholipase